MKIVLIGATGATGRQVLSQALERGDTVTAYVRSPDRLQDVAAAPGLTVVPGQVDDTEHLAAAMEGAEAVVVTLGPGHQAKSLVRCTVMRQCLPAIASAMERAGLRRIVVLSAWGVGATARTAAPPTRLAFHNPVYADHEEAEEALRERLDLTTVHPVILTDGPMQDALVRPDSGVERVTGVQRISRAAVAGAMLDAAHNPGTIGERLIVQPRPTPRA